MPKRKPGHLSRAEMSALIGVSLDQLRELHRSGVIAREGVDSYDPAKVVSSYCDHLRAQQASATAEVSTSTLAGILGLTQRRVRQLAKEGAIARRDRDRFALGEAVSRYLNHIREGVGAISLAEQSARLRKSQADKAERLEEEARGQNVDRRDITVTVLEILSAVLGMLDGLPSRVANDATQRVQIKLECKRARAEVAQALRSVAAGGGRLPRRSTR